MRCAVSGSETIPRNHEGWRASPGARWLGLRALLITATFAMATAGSLTLPATQATAQRADDRPIAPNALRKIDEAADKRAQRLRPVRNWGYWLSSYDIGDVVAAPHDLMVVDNGVSANRRFVRERSLEEVARMKQRPDGSARVLLSYLSFGEAERYRAYWRPEWYDRNKRPAWLGETNPDWDGNYHVQYWQPEWQALLFGAAESYLDVIMAQGFDGVYLDRADAFLHWEKSRPSARFDMAAYIRRLSDYARKRNPDFLVVMQNAEELLDDAEVLESIDGIAKEDLLYGIDRPEASNKPQDVRHSLQQLRLARNAGRKVLVVEYLGDPAKMAAASKRILDEGFVPYFAPRLLNCLNPPAGALPASTYIQYPCR